jgi:hypothetical protein
MALLIEPAKAPRTIEWKIDQVQREPGHLPRLFQRVGQEVAHRSGAW